VSLSLSLICRRDEWRKELDSRIALIKVTNAERSVLVRDNITLRTTVECGRQVRDGAREGGREGGMDTTSVVALYPLTHSLTHSLYFFLPLLITTHTSISPSLLGSYTGGNVR
jgi:hypothetical protein